MKVNITCHKLPFIALAEKTPVDFSVLIEIAKQERAAALFSMTQIELVVATGRIDILHY